MEPLAITSAGVVQGQRLDGAEVFRGIPYAAPPVGPMRFRPPRPHRSWAGVRDAGGFGPIAVQPPSALEAHHGTHQREQHEDCLTLNVFTPGCDGKARPVMVWIHGGAFLTGTGSNATFDGTAFARDEVVLVAINYRLNVFGYLHLAGLADDEVGSGNCGLLDQVAALQWVRENIAAFGGDPHRVTVFGESAGAMSVATLLGTPAARGLFHRAILQSGAANNVLTADDATGVAADVLAALGLPGDAGGIAALRARSASEVSSAYGTVVQRRYAASTPEDMRFLFAPVVDGAVLPRAPIEAVRGGSARAIPLVVGTVRDEMEVMRLQAEGFYDFDAAEVERRFESVFAERAAEARALYRSCSSPGGNVWTVVDGDRGFLAPMSELADAHEQAGGQCWMYLFAWSSPAFDGALGAFHSLENAFVFDTLDRGAGPAFTGGPPASARPLARRMNRAWAGFARSGAPAHDDLPAWPPHTSAERATMVFDQRCVVADDPLGARRRFWEWSPARGSTRHVASIELMTQE